MMTGLRMSGDCVIVIAWAAQFSSSRVSTEPLMMKCWLHSRLRPEQEEEEEEGRRGGEW